MYYYLKNNNETTKIMHLRKCRHLARAKQVLGVYDTAEEGYRHGARICKHCNVLKHKFLREKEEIQKISQEKGIKCELKNDYTLTIVTSKSKWIVINGKTSGFMQLFHKNTKEKTATGLFQGYHDQKVFNKSILYYLTYVKEHDVFRKQNPIEHTPKQYTKAYKKYEKRKKNKQRRKSIGRVYGLLNLINAG